MFINATFAKIVKSRILPHIVITTKIDSMYSLFRKGGKGDLIIAWKIPLYPPFAKGDLSCIHRGSPLAQEQRLDFRLRGSDRIFDFFRNRQSTGDDNELYKN